MNLPQLNLSQRWLEFFSKWFPEKVADLAYKRMFTPPPYPFKSRDIKALETASFLKINCNSHSVATWSWNSLENKKRVLLVHGWAGASVQFKHFVQPLIREGFNVTLLDLPAHGRSPGTSTHLPASSRVIVDVVQHFGDIEAMIAHSFGATAASVALNWGAEVSKVVLFAPMSDLPKGLGRVAKAYGATSNVYELVRCRAEESFNVSWEELSPACFSHQLNIPALIIHDKDDSEVELSQSYRLQMMWPKSKLQITEGLGHYRVLRNKDLIEQSIHFIKEPA